MNEKEMVVELYLIHTGFLEDEQIFQKKLRQVSSKRREKVLSHKIREDQKRSLATGLLLEYVLAEKGYPKEKIMMEKGGKLFLEGVDDFFFSISHSGEYGACVVSDVLVGVDIQQKRRTKGEIAKRFFHEEEVKILESYPEEKKEDIFFRFWTGKESYLKLKGEGLTGRLDNFVVDLEEKKIIDSYNHNREIYLKEYKCLEGYYISVACYSNKFATFVKKIHYRL